MQTLAAEIYCKPQVRPSTIIPNSLKKKENLHVPEQLGGDSDHNLLLEEETSAANLAYVSRSHEAMVKHCYMWSAEPFS